MKLPAHMTASDQFPFEYLDEVPEGFVFSAHATLLEELGVPVFARRWRNGALECADMYIPEWAYAVNYEFVMNPGSISDLARDGNIEHLKREMLSDLARLDNAAQRSALTVLTLGGLKALIEHVRAQIDARIGLAEPEGSIRNVRVRACG